MLAQSRAWPEILEKRFLCPRCGLSSPICPVASKCWPHTGLLHVPPDLCPTCTLLYTEGYSQFPPCLTNLLTLLVHISPSKPTASSHDYTHLLLLTCESEHISSPYFVGLSLCWGPAVFPLSLCTHCSSVVAHARLLPGRMLNLPEVLSDPSSMFPKAL